MIFVFGSNTAGRHGAGAAAYARQHHGAVYGVGRGRTGNSYALPTKKGTRRGKLSSCTIVEVLKYIREFCEYARQHPDENFQVTRVGCGLAGFSDEAIANMFKPYSSDTNLYFDTVWKPYLNEDAQYWGTI